MAEIDSSSSEPGNILARRRADRGWTQEEVAKKLHLSPSIIRKLETNQFDDQIPDAFARGYLRNYAKLVGVEQQEVIAAYTQLIGQSKLKNYYEPTKTVNNPSATGASINQIVGIVLLAIPVIAILIWYIGRDVDSTELEATDTTDQVNEAQSSDSQPPLDNVTIEQTAPTVNNRSANDNQSNEVSTELQPVQEATQSTEVPTGFVETAEAVLDFDFVDDCWVQITDSNGEVLAVGLKTKGRSFQVSGIAPINVVLGKPNAVKIAYNRSDVDLACFPASSTARFSLNSPIACND